MNRSAACAIRSCAKSESRSTIGPGLAGYSFVLDTSAESINQAPFILFNTGQSDLTEEILSQMNIGAPAGVLDAAGKDIKAPDIKLNIPDQNRPREKEKPPAKGSKK